MVITIQLLIFIVLNDNKKAPTLTSWRKKRRGDKPQTITVMIIMQSNALSNGEQNPYEQVLSLPLVSTCSLYAQIETLRNVYLLTKNPYLVAQHGRLLADEVRTLSRQLETLIEGLDPMIREAIASHSIEAEHL